MKRPSFQVRNGSTSLPCDHCGCEIGRHSKGELFCPPEQCPPEEPTTVIWDPQFDAYLQQTSEVPMLELTDLRSVSGKDRRPRTWGSVLFLSGLVLGALVLWAALKLRGVL